MLCYISKILSRFAFINIIEVLVKSTAVAVFLLESLSE